VHLPYRDRTQAGRLLGDRLDTTLDRLGLADPAVLALPRGGVVVARPVADALHAPLDVWCVRKVGMPGHQELAIGAVASGDVEVLDRDLIRRAGLHEDTVDEVVAGARERLAAQERSLRGDRAVLDVTGRPVVLVDDGLATGSTARAACLAVRAAGAEAVVLAVPVASRTGLRQVREVTDEVVCPAAPAGFHAVGSWYDDFSEVSDEQVRTLLAA
jgi:putative phosphoribosyl transferase